MYQLTYYSRGNVPWNKGKLVGQKPPLKLKEVWASGFGCKLPRTFECTPSGPCGPNCMTLEWDNGVGDCLKSVYVLICSL